MIHYTVVVLLLRLYMTEGSPSCLGHQNENGTLSFSVNSSRECDDYSWKIKDSVVAYDQNFSKTLVQERGRSHIIFKSCQTNVSYFCDKEMTITCYNVCPTEPPSKEERHQENDTNGAGVLAAIIIAVVAVVVIIGVIVATIARKLKICQPGDNSVV